MPKKKEEVYLAINQQFGEFPYGDVVLFKAKDFTEASEIGEREELGMMVVMNKSKAEKLKKKLDKMF
jgi:hypothetical protein